MGPWAPRLALAAVAACGAIEDGSFDPDACADWSALQSFGLQWADYNHRISVWRVEPSAAGCPARSADVAYVGGDFTTGETATDTPTVTLGVRSVAATPDAFGVARVRVPLDVGPSGVAETRITLDRAGEGLLGYPVVTAALDGLSLTTDVDLAAGYAGDYDPAHGYTSRGIGAEVVVEAANAASVTIRVTARVAHGASDRADMNAALPFAHTQATVGVAVIGTRDAPISGARSFTLSYPRQRLGVDPVHEPAGDDQTRLTLRGRPGGPEGVVALKRFWFALSAPDGCGASQLCPAGDTCVDGVCGGAVGLAGFYVRALRVGVDQRAYDAVTGALTVHVDGYVSNGSRGLDFFALTSAFDAAVVWFQVPAGPAEEFEVPFATGSTTITWGAP